MTDWRPIADSQEALRASVSASKKELDALPVRNAAGPYESLQRDFQVGDEVGLAQDKGGQIIKPNRYVIIEILPNVISGEPEAKLRALQEPYVGDIRMLPFDEIIHLPHQLRFEDRVAAGSMGDWLERSKDKWQGPASVTLNEGVEMPGETGARTMEGINAPVVDKNWMYLNGEVMFGGHYWDLAHLLASQLKLSEDEVRLISNSVARNHLPAHVDIAYGEMRHDGYPQIWASTLDRNAVWDAVVRKHQEQEHQKTATMSIGPQKDEWWKIGCPECGNPEMDVHLHGGLSCTKCGQEYEQMPDGSLISSIPPEPEGVLWPDTIPWGEAEQDYYRKASNDPYGDLRDWAGKFSWTYVPSLDRVFFGDDHERIWQRDVPVSLGLATDEDIDRLWEDYIDGGQELLHKTQDWRMQHAKDVVSGWIDREGQIQVGSGSWGKIEDDFDPATKEKAKQRVQEEMFRTAALTVNPVNYEYIPLTEGEMARQKGARGADWNWDLKARRYNKRGRDSEGGGHVSPTELYALTKRFDFNCAYCGKPLQEDSITFDHVVPLRLGGTNDAANLLPTCHPCNRSMDEWDWRLNPEKEVRYNVPMEAFASAPRLGEAAMAKLVAEGGFSLNLDGTPVAPGYYTSIEGHERQIEMESIIPADIDNYIHDHLDILNQRDNFLGAWVTDGRVYLDVSRSFQTEDEMIEFARANHQIAGWDGFNHVEIPVTPEDPAIL